MICGNCMPPARNRDAREKTGIGKRRQRLFHRRDDKHPLAVKRRLVFVQLAVMRRKILLGDTLRGVDGRIKGLAAVFGETRALRQVRFSVSSSS